MHALLRTLCAVVVLCMPGWLAGAAHEPLDGARPAACAADKDALVSAASRRLLQRSSAASCGDAQWLSGGQAWSCAVLAPSLILHWRQESDASFLLGVTASPASRGGAPVDWVGIGLAEAGGMPGADIVLLRRNLTSRARWLVEDRFATQYATPALDAQADKQLVSVQESSSGVVRAVVRVPLQPCDLAQDRPIFPGPQPLIFAFGRGPFGYHGTVNRGDITLTLIPEKGSTGTNATRNATTTTLDITMPTLKLPNEDTDYYYCVDVELPADRARHLISYTPIINSTLPKGVGRVVHHTVLYNCTKRPPTFGKGVYRCEAQPEDCSTYTLVSAGVPTTQTMPSEAGFRLGPNGIRYATLQVHYSNPDLAKGVVDASGFKVTLTTALRAHDMGVLALGWESFAIPGRSTNYSLGPAICPPGCTRRFSAPINVVSTMLHMHKIGASMSTQHIRNTSELRPLATIRYYQFGYQPSLTVASGTRVVRPGDTFITDCRFTNPLSTQVTYGYRSTDEMCYSYNWFWPLSAAQGVSHCTSQGDLGAELPVCGDSRVAYQLGDFLASANIKTRDDAIAAIRVAAARGWVVITNATAVTSSYQRFNSVPATCSKRTNGM